MTQPQRQYLGWEDANIVEWKAKKEYEGRKAWFAKWGPYMKEYEWVIISPIFWTLYIYGYFNTKFFVGNGFVRIFVEQCGNPVSVLWNGLRINGSLKCRLLVNLILGKKFSWNPVHRDAVDLVDGLRPLMERYVVYIKLLKVAFKISNFRSKFLIWC